MKPVGIALVGAGFIADYHLSGLKPVDDAEVRLIVSRTTDSAGRVARQHGIAEASNDFEAALRRRDIDAVIITTPDDTHEELAAAALRAGRAVLLQKPMAPDSAACRRLLSVAAETGADLQVSFMHRYFEEVVAARALIGAGHIGTINSVRLRNATPGPNWGDWFFRRDVVGGGVVLQLGIHGIDLIGHLFGPIKSVSATVDTLVPTRRLRDGRDVPVENADTAHACYRTAGGIVVQHEMSMIEQAGTDRFRMEIYGTAGTLWLRSERGRLASFRCGAPDWQLHPLPDVAAGQRHHQDWVDGITGRKPRLSTARDAFAGLLVAEAIAESGSSDGVRTTVRAPA